MDDGWVGGSLNKPGMLGWTAKMVHDFREKLENYLTGQLGRCIQGFSTLNLEVLPISRPEWQCDNE
jgi:hypothetical protein